MKNSQMERLKSLYGNDRAVQLMSEALTKTSNSSARERLRQAIDEYCMNNAVTCSPSYGNMKFDTGCELTVLESSDPGVWVDGLASSRVVDIDQAAPGPFTYRNANVPQTAYPGGAGVGAAVAVPFAPPGTSTTDVGAQQAAVGGLLISGSQQDRQQQAVTYTMNLSCYQNIDPGMWADTGSAGKPPKDYDRTWTIRFRGSISFLLLAASSDGSGNYYYKPWIARNDMFGDTSGRSNATISFNISSGASSTRDSFVIKPLTQGSPELARAIQTAHGLRVLRSCGCL